MDRGKILWEDDLQEFEGRWGRYLDVDGDGIPYRTLPGNRLPNAAYFARGTGHDEYANYSEQPKDWENNLLRLARKINNNTSLLPKPVTSSANGATIGIISYGSTDLVVMEALTILSNKGLKLDHMRIRALPAGQDVKDFIRTHERNYVIELNRDGQLHQILTLEAADCAMQLLSLAHLDGLPLTAEWVVNQVEIKEELAK
jgi:2-oxoglutarate ferredoxin oxidoreductase subunit alpha